MIYKLVYLSQESSDFSENNLKTLDDILKVSRENNSKNDITGVLIYSQGYILQILEGDKKKVNSLYNKIESDPRHKNIKLLMKGEAEERNFSKWFMGFKLLEEQTYSNYLRQNNILEKVSFKDFVFNQEKPIEVIIDLLSGKYDSA